MSIDRYLMLSMIRGGVPILGLLLGLFAFLTLAEELEDVGKGNFEVIDALNVMVYSLPKISLELLPVTSLIGVLVGLGALASQQELIALRAAGWSNYRLARPVLVLALAIITAAMATQQWLIPLLEEQIAGLRANAVEDAELEGESEFWTRNEHQIVRIGGVQFGLMPTDVEIFERDEAGHVTRVLNANRADILNSSTWQLWDVVSTEIQERGTRVGRMETLEWRSVLTPDQMATIITTAAALAPSDLVQYVAHLEENDLDSHRYRLVLWQQLSLPIGILGMALLGVPFVVGSTRSMATGTRISIGVVIGILFYLGERTLGQIALLYSLPPIPLAMGPDIFILFLALYALSRAR
ncbi:MAG: LPS export ABC transporter permease LptG [Gammaproteobacteria bacterium]|nr:MAG: LPS export ABC transporter permease LptG [Gammaproteobacteria bacterium]